MNKTAIKITMLVAGLCTSLLVLLNFLVLSRSNEDLGQVFQAVPIRYNGVNVVELQPASVNPFQEKFAEQFRNSLVIIDVLGIIGSLLIGIIAAQIITQPLRRLENGIKKLQQNDYRIQLAKTGAAEFDQLINEFNRLASELAKVEMLRKDLISDTSHELKTPITALMAQLQAIQDQLLEPTTERITILLGQVHRLNELVDRLQEYTKLRSKTMMLNITKINLHELISQSTVGYAERLVAKGMKLTNMVAPNYIISADISLLERLIHNLIENALKYSQATDLKISATGTEITVEDNGVGVNAEHLDYLFERFYRVDKSRSRDTGGLGLGLAIVKEICEAHGWSIKADNLNNGLRFTITVKTTA